jgi:hypothetical protein
MTTATLPATDALELFSRLTIPDLVARLEALEAEHRALTTLLRALQARERGKARAKGVRHE